MKLRIVVQNVSHTARPFVLEGWTQGQGKTRRAGHLIHYDLTVAPEECAYRLKLDRLIEPGEVIIIEADADERALDLEWSTAEACRGAFWCRELKLGERSMLARPGLLT